MTIKTICLFILLCLFAVPVLCDDPSSEQLSISALKKKLSTLTADPTTRKYLSGALLGSAFAVATQPFKNAREHFLVILSHLFISHLFFYESSVNNILYASL
jgi:hypothetical protein